MCATLHDLSLVQNDDLITVPYGGQAMCYHDAGNAPVLDSLHKIKFCLCIQCAGGLVHNDESRILCQLTLSTGKVLSVFGQLALIAAGALQNIVMYLRIPCSKDHLIICNSFVPHFYIVGDRVLKQHDILIDHCDRACKHAAVNVCGRLSVKQQLTLPGLIQSRYQFADGRLSAAAGSHYRNALPRFYIHGEIGDHGLGKT